MTRELTFEEADHLAEAERLGTFEQVARELTGWTEPGTIRMQGRGWVGLQLVLVPHATA
jgi:hypothetical protein